MREKLESFRVLPVVTAVDVDSTVQLAAALRDGGMRAIEITLRTEAALEAIAAVSEAVPDINVASGTVTFQAVSGRAGGWYLPAESAGGAIPGYRLLPDRGT